MFRCCLDVFVHVYTEKFRSAKIFTKNNKHDHKRKLKGVGYKIR